MTLTITRTLTEVRNRDLNVGVQHATLNSHLWYLACSLLNILHIIALCIPHLLFLLIIHFVLNYTVLPVVVTNDVYIKSIAIC